MLKLSNITKEDIMIKKTAVMFLIFFISIASAQSFVSGKLALGLKVGSLGYGGEAIMNVISPLNARIGMNFLSLSPDLGDAAATEDYTMDATINLQAFYAVLDFYPFHRSSFHLSGGMYMSTNNIESKIHPIQTYTIGGDEYTPEKLGDIDLELKMDGTCPYLGFGFGNRLNGNSGLGMNIDIGGYYQGSPTAKMFAEGLIEPTASPDQEKIVEDSLEGLTWYPIVTFGLVYKF